VIKHSESLIVVSGAKDPSYRTYPDGREHVMYTVEAEYPAEKIISAISGQLGKKGWKPLREDFMNPGIQSSRIRGWKSFADATQQPEEGVHSWVADWESPAHDIVVYTLEYRTPGAAVSTYTHSLKTLQVIGLYIPARVAADMKKLAAASRAGIAKQNRP